MLPDSPFYAILDTGYVSEERCVEKFEELVNGGSRLLQVRAKKESQQQRRELLESVLKARESLSAEIQPAIIINDDIELCLEFDDVGLHIGQDDTPPEEARERIGPAKILGLSTHSSEQIDKALSYKDGLLSYFAVGPIFPTQTKPDYEAVGLELIHYAAAKKPSIPFYCIGGINRENVSQAITAGAKRVVTVSDVLLATDTTKAVSQTISKIRKEL